MVTNFKKTYRNISYYDTSNNSKRISLPTTLFALYTMLIPLDSIMNITGSGTINRYIGILTIVSMMAYKILKKERIYIIKEYIFLLVYFSFAFISLFWSINKEITISSIYRLFFLIVFYMACSNMNYADAEKNLIKNASILGGTLISIYLISISDLHYSRVFIISNRGQYTDPNGLSSSLAFGAIFLVDYLLQTKKMSNRIFLLVCLIIIIYGMLLTGSRGGIVGLTLGIAFLVLLGSKGKRNSRLKIFIIITLIFMLVIILGSGILSNYLDIKVLDRMTINSIIETGGTGRLIIWKNAYAILKNSPIIGYGFASAPYVIYQNFGTYVSTHNDILFLLLGTGILGLLLFVIFFIKMIKRCVINRDILSLSMLVMLISFSGTLDYLFNKNLWNIFIYIQIGLGAGGLDRKTT